MLTAKQKFLLGEMILPFSYVNFVAKTALVDSALDDCYLEICNSLGQSYIFSFDAYSVSPSNPREVHLRLNADVVATEIRFKNCQFDLDPIGIGADPSITCELITPSAIQATDVFLYMPLPAVNLGIPVFSMSNSEMKITG
ncbi:hypothetical protein FCV82_02145 [Vibrio breoganii]|uniref:hypothetical protein n=1 Tax=Vibrio breoganii TaxID=553239 RepID=UPI000C841898|nr:hypothetical protein [Vibrio breoganii]PMN67096.1 hypothetical protein BCT28_03840 [Vibrio breoganii]PMO82927.1 hypothetical protein BCT00_06760 [Vibrio breoganii]TKF90394.1 hypothetical protein FCV82_02145 [Vibrio breoganii]